ncbi:MAG: OadG family protein [Pseudomonadales bacterium]|nr:OadG family protein [Pseudomonadales bacterium]
MNELLVSGLELMLIGMGSVFLFLSMLVLTTRIMSKIVMQLQSPVDLLQPSVLPSEIKINTETEDKRLIAVISAAIHQHRNSPNHKIDK